jgi:hypothetical protein
MICQKHSNARFYDRLWEKMIQLSTKHYSHQDVTFHPTPYFLKIGIKKKYKNTSFVYTSMHEKIYMDMDSLMPKKRKDLFVSKNIITSRRRLNRNHMICDYMRLIVIYN